MEQFAELGYFIIKYIEDFELTMTVGVNEGIPQIWFMPDEERDADNTKKDYQITADNPKTVERLNRIRESAMRRLATHRDHLSQLFGDLVLAN